MKVTVREVREIISGFGIKTYSGYNDKRKTFERRLKVITKKPLSSGQMEQVKLLTGAFEVGYVKSQYCFGGLYIKIK